jgi:hypothetical protein
MGRGLRRRPVVFSNLTTSKIYNLLESSVLTLVSLILDSSKNSDKFFSKQSLSLRLETAARLPPGRWQKEMGNSPGNYSDMHVNGKVPEASDSKQKTSRTNPGKNSEKSGWKNFWHNPIRPIKF